MDVLALLSAIYVAIAIFAILRTIAEGISSPEAGLFGTLAGCVLCLFWLPLFLALVAMRAMSAKSAGFSR